MLKNVKRGNVADILPLDEPTLGDEEIKYLTDCIRSGWLSWQGTYVRRLEEEFARYCGCEHASAMANGSSALLVALQALGIGPGDEVIVPTLTFSATAFAVSMVGARVRFLDCAPGSMTLDTEAFEASITPSTRAVIPVHLYGRPADMEPICSIARAHSVRVIEDAAQAVGAEYQGRRVGGFGDIGCFSFHNKLIASGEGGVITTQDWSIAETINLLKNPSPDNRTTFDRISINYRMSNLHAAVALAQLERLEDVVAGKRRIARLYDELLTNVPGIKLLPAPDETRSVYWRYSVAVTQDFPLSRDALVAALCDSGYQARALYQPLHRHPYYRQHAQESHPIAEELAATGLDLPSAPDLSADQVRRVAECIAESGSKHRRRHAGAILLERMQGGSK